MRRNVPESPRWLSAHGKSDKADEIVSKAEQFVQSKLGEQLPAVEAVEVADERTDINLKLLFYPPFLLRLLLFATTWFFYYIGNYAWLTLTPELLDKKGIELSEYLSPDTDRYRLFGRCFTCRIY